MFEEQVIAPVESKPKGVQKKERLLVRVEEELMEEEEAPQVEEVKPYIPLRLSREPEFNRDSLN